MPRRTDIAGALANSERQRLLLELLQRSPQTVSELVAATGMSQPQVSKHLVVLDDAGLVTHKGKSNGVTQPAVVLRLLEQLNAAARSATVMRIGELRRELDEEDQVAAKLSGIRETLGHTMGEGTHAARSERGQG
jgi:DNA-binding transcriptional ArsR family regulator